MEDVKNPTEQDLESQMIQGPADEDKPDERLAKAIVSLCEGHPIQVVSVALQLATMRVNRVVGNQTFVDDAK